MTPDDNDGRLICGVLTADLGALGKWPGVAPALPWHLDTAGYRGGFTVEAIRAAYAKAWRLWAAVIDIDPIQAESPGHALIRAHFARIDGGSGVLAWSELANNTNSPKTQRYDNGESWVIDTVVGGIDLVRVAAHEIGHVLGLGHDSSSAVALMRPSYSTAIPAPTVRDFDRMLALGYRRRAAPPPSPPPTPPDPPPLERHTVLLPGGERAEFDMARKIASLPMGWTVVRH